MLMETKQSIECWILTQEQPSSVLLMHVGAKKSHPHFFQPITGGIEKGENPIEACIREIREETGIEIEESELQRLPETFLAKINDNLAIEKTIFTTRLPESDITINPAEHTGYQWAQTQEVESLLYWQSNKDTWKIVSKHL